MHQLAQAWLVLIIDISIKSMLLAGVAGLALFTLRLRDTNLQHRVWTAVLLGMLAMPALVYVTPAVPLPGWLVLAIPAASTEPNPIGDKLDDAPVANLPRKSLDAAGKVSHASDSNSNALANSVMNELPPDAPGAMQPLEALDSPKANPIADTIQTAQHPSITAKIANQLSPVLASLYCSVAVVFVLRLLVGLSLTHRLIGEAREIHLASPLPLPRRRSLRLLESTSVHVPATVGFVRPVVLLPAGWRRWTESKLRAVLAHELAHVRRADWLVNALGELNRALYWFHPVAWIIRRRLSELAELNCDDAVLEVDGDRTQYARYLLEVASSFTNAGSRYTAPLHGIAMARKPNVETRIVAILDVSRPLARRLGALGVIGLLVTGLPAILLAAALQPAAKDGPQPKRTAKQESANFPVGAVIPAAADPAAPARIQLFGKVVRPDGNPAVGAQVYLLQDSPMATEPVAMVATTADGGFAFDVGKDVFNVDETSEPWLIAKVLAKADGFGPAWALAASFEPSGKMAKNLPLYPNMTDRRGELVAGQTLRLVTDDVPIEGRIVSIEGHPIAGARMRVMEIHRTGQPTLDSWLTAVEDQLTAFDKAWPQLRVSTGFDFRRQIERLFPDIKSDKDGRFRIAGVGRESIVELQIEGPGIETRQISARTRKGEMVRIADRRFLNEQAKMFYGSRFDHVAGPSHPVKGVVRDKDTRKPLAGVKVQAYRLAGVGVQPYPNAMFYTLSDTEGRYQLDGLPVGANMLLAIGPASEPYIVSALPAEVNPIQTETTVDFALKRGIWIRGRVTDASDGRSLRANVYYAVFEENSRSQEAPGYSDAFSLWYPTDADGRFRMPGFAGRGIVGVRAANYSDYPKGVGADRIEGRETNNGWTDLRTEPSDFGWAENYHAVAAVSPDEKGANNECNFALVPGRKISGNLFDSAGDPLKGAIVHGAVEGRVWQLLDDASFTVHNVDPLKPRRVQFLHRERKLAGSVTVKGDEAGPISVKLQPWATITGRIVDTFGDPLQSASLASDEGDKGQLGAMPGYFVFAADAEGHFKIEGLAPRLPYNLRVIVPGYSLGTVVKDLQLSPGETKDLGDLSVKRPSN